MAKRKSKKKAPKKQTRKPKTRRPSNRADKDIYLEYEITEEPIPSRAYDRLPESVRDQLDRLHDDSQSRRAKEAIEELLVLKNKYPKIPQIYNYLAAAYSYTREMDKANEITLECIQVNPSYLFARLNYIEFCLREKRYDEISAIVDHKTDLKLLYPKRKKFHISEYTGFMGVLGLYFAKTGEHDKAQYYLESLQQIAPRHRVTRTLKRELHPNFFWRFLRRAANTDSAKLSDTASNKE